MDEFSEDVAVEEKGVFALVAGLELRWVRVWERTYRSKPILLERPKLGDFGRTHAVVRDRWETPRSTTVSFAEMVGFPHAGGHLHRPGPDEGNI